MQSGILNLVHLEHQLHAFSKIPTEPEWWTLRNHQYTETDDGRGLIRGTPGWSYEWGALLPNFTAWTPYVTSKYILPGWGSPATYPIVHFLHVYATLKHHDDAPHLLHFSTKSWMLCILCLRHLSAPSLPKSSQKLSFVLNNSGQWYPYSSSLCT